ncbi:MAG: hypothetical protein K6T83_00170 [Alicyclobacillus sp.]|nr:hypothetical protein [Alicyclobacillus sp.]
MSSRKPDYKALATQPRRRLPHEAFVGAVRTESNDQSVRQIADQVLNSDDPKASNDVGEVATNEASNNTSSESVDSLDESSNQFPDDLMNERDQTVGNDLDVILGKKKPDKRYRGFYLSPELDDALDFIKNKYGKGALSELVNAILTEDLTKRGIIKRQ